MLIHILITDTYIGNKQNKAWAVFTLLIFERTYCAISTYLGQSVFHSWPPINVHTDLLHLTDKRKHSLRHPCTFAAHNMTRKSHSGPPRKDIDCPQTVFKNTSLKHKAKTWKKVFPLISVLVTWVVRCYT